MMNFEWVGVKDKLPDAGPGTSFTGLVTDGRSVMVVTYWLRHWNSLTGEKELVWSSYPGSPEDLTQYITHWAPYPEPPK
jgi:hypothetical protein